MDTDMKNGYESVQHSFQLIKCTKNHLSSASSASLCCSFSTVIMSEKGMSSTGSKKQEKRHAVCIPFPAQGHINPMLMMAKLLHHSGFHITFVNTVYNHRRLLKSNGAASLQGLDGFRFEKIHDGLPATDDDDDATDATQDIIPLCQSIIEYFATPFRELVAKLNDASEAPPVTCIVSDLSMPFTSPVAEELGIPIALLLTAGACGFSSVAYYPELLARGLLPLKDESCFGTGGLDTAVEFIPGVEGIRLRDLYTFFRTGKPDDVIVRFNHQKLENTSRANAIVANTFDDLERKVLEGLPATLPKVFPIGPLHLSLSRIPSSSALHSICSNLWSNEAECITWLGRREPRSVLYLNLGSIAAMTPQQATELAWGLADSEQPFLWIIRPDMAASGGVVLPPGFLAETEGRGLVAGWCQQEQVLSHPAVGGFLTHCGWNSSIESVAAGVPMICWPFFADQRTNCWCACNRWGVGMELGEDVRRGEVERLVREVMEGGERGKDMRVKAVEWKRLAEDAVSSDGSSSLNFERFVNQVLH
uniref:Glycosyltransferase n=1 Tax=Kalanchoe fedtschenkoi TaxID=63787 RepID=A0A7N0TVM8_KALFE